MNCNIKGIPVPSKFRWEAIKVSLLSESYPPPTFPKNVSTVIKEYQYLVIIW